MKNNDNKLNYALYSLIMTALVVLGLIFITLLTDRREISWDMTSRKLFSLSDVTEDLLDSLDNNVEILILYNKGKETRQIMGILEQYGAHPRVELTVMDPDENPAMLAPYDTAENPLEIGSLIIRSGSHWKVLHDTDLYVVDYTGEAPKVFGIKAEQLISSAIAYVRSGRIPLVYELSGHGERIFSGTGVGGDVEAANFHLEELNILNRSGVPEDADILMITGPQQDFTDYERGKIEEYLEQEGRLFLSLGYSKDPRPNIEAILKTYNMEMLNGVVMEQDSSRKLPEFGDNPFFFIPIMGDDEVSAFIKNSQTNPFFAASMGFREISSVRRDIQVEPFLHSSDSSFLRQDMSRPEMTAIDSDLQGPIDTGVLMTGIDSDTGLEEGTRMVVVGSPTAFSNMGGIGVFPGNVRLMIGSLQWLDDHETALSVPNKSLLESNLTISTGAALIFGALTSLVIPLAIFLTGFFLLRKRRNL